MVICVIAAVVLGILSVFSAKYRKWAKESFHCVFRMTTLRKCDTEFDKKLKTAIVGRLIVNHQKLAGIVHRRFAVLSWIFALTFIVSLAYTGLTVYNLAVYGTCDPVGGQCILTQTTNAGTEECVQANELIASVYFDNSAKVMYFYQDGCPWCAREATVLEGLAKEGYKVKPMHLNSNQSWWTEYSIKVTPTFIGPDGERMTGYHESDLVKDFLGKYK